MTESLPPFPSRSLLQKDALEVARCILGMQLHKDSVILRITETEAYRYPEDSACHAHKGLTERNRPMWGPPGRSYVYLCYGIHNMLNVVTNPEGQAAAVLIRGCEIVEGTEAVVSRRRGMRFGPDLLNGPGKIGAALGLDTGWSNHDLLSSGGLELREGRAPRKIVCGPRVGIDYAEPRHRDAPWRLADGDSKWVSHRKLLK